MAGFVYLIRNGDLHKIGRTDNLQRRFKQLQPDEIVQVLETDRSRDLEHELHQQFKAKRLPQTEYFRLDDAEVNLVRIALGGEPDGPVIVPPLHAIHDDIARGRRNTKIAAVGVAFSLAMFIVDPHINLLPLSAALFLFASADYGVRWGRQKLKQWKG